MRIFPVWHPPLAGTLVGSGPQLVGLIRRRGVKEQGMTQDEFEQVSAQLVAVIAAVEEGRPRVLTTDGAKTLPAGPDRKSTRLNSSHVAISYAVFRLKRKKQA